MSEDDWVDVTEAPLIADVTWLDEHRNGAPLVDERWQPIDLSEIPDEPPVQPSLGGMGLAYPGKRHVFSGPQESAKTLCAYLLGLEVMRAGGAFCLLDFEMGRWDARNRLRELGATQDELREIVYFDPEGKMPERVPGQVIELVQGKEAVVLIDASAGAFAYQELDDNKRMDVERFAAVYVEPFRRAGIATLVIDHVVKSTEARGNYAIGSERKVGQTDVHIGFTVVTPIKRGTTGVYKLTTHKDRGGFLKRGKLADLELRSDPETHDITWDIRAATEVDPDHPFRPTVKMEQASKWLERQMEERVPMSHIEQGIGGDREAGRLAIQILVDDGYFQEEKGPRNARLMTIVRPYREEHDDLSATSPHLSGELAQTTSPALRTPYGGGDVGEVVSGTGEVSSPQLAEDDDGIPF